MFMNLAAFKSTIDQKLSFQFQEIVNADKQTQNWIEMLYRPNHMMGHPDMEHYFKALNTQQKVDLDIKVFQEINQVLNDHRPRRLSVNLMPISLLSPQFRSQLWHQLDNDVFDANQICIEIVETHSMPPLCSGAIDLIRKFRAKGGWIALDDFGSGFAHWELLQMGLIDVIKVANQNLQHQGVNQFTYGLSRFADSMNIRSVLEGVETFSDFQRGRAQGFQNFQGWLFK
jgi:EAL domain-containing protein (putative c-di-GMP-specific phosphodiesterase class I)